MTANDLVKFWQKSAEADLKVAEDNIKLGHFHWALFFFQLVKEITSYNIEARYDDIKLSFYKKATREYAQIWAEKCRNYYQWLKEQ